MRLMRDEESGGRSDGETEKQRNGEIGSRIDEVTKRLGDGDGETERWGDVKMRLMRDEDIDGRRDGKTR